MLHINTTLKKIAIEHGATVKFVGYSNWTNWAGYTNSKTKEITIIASDQSIEQIICTFFHEIGHIICMKKGKYKIYHNPDYRHNAKYHERIVKNGWKAEVYVDKIGRKEMKKHFPNIPYYGFYENANEEQKIEFETELSNTFKEYRECHIDVVVTLTKQMDQP
jgi:hypothetical protein